ncbi:YhfC family glutamic-type intramembrane protease [Cystobacter fuscus]
MFEETARLIAFKYPLKDFRRWRDAVGFGIGHGGLESAVLVGGMAIIGLINVVALSRLDPPRFRCPRSSSSRFAPRRPRWPGCAGGSPCWAPMSAWGPWRFTSP